MTPPTNPPTASPGGDWSESDRVWFERLAGRMPAGARDHAQAMGEAERLARAIDAEERSLAADERLQTVLAPARGEEKLRELFGTLRRERLLRPDAGERPYWQRWRLWAPVGGFAVAATLAAFLVVPLLMVEHPAYDEPPTMRGEIVEQQRQHATPREAAEAMAARLRAAGGDVRLYQTGKIFIVDIEVQPPVPDALTQALAADGLPAAPGHARVAFAKP